MQMVLLHYDEQDCRCGDGVIFQTSRTVNVEMALLLLHYWWGEGGLLLLHCYEQQDCKCGDGVIFQTNRTVNVEVVLLLLHYWWGEGGCCCYTVMSSKTVNVVMVLHFRPIRL